MNNPISSWLRKGALPLALVCLAGPALASRTVTSSDSGGGPLPTVASDNRNICGRADFLDWADACSGFFNYGEDGNAVEALVSSYNQTNPNAVWGNSAPQIYRPDGTADSLFTTRNGSDPRGNIYFNRNFAGSFVVVLSGTWDDVSTTDSTTVDRWSAYYLFDDVIASAGPPLSMSFGLYGALAPNDPHTIGDDVYVMRGLSVNQVAIYQFAVPEPSSLLLSGLALGALGAAAARARRRRLTTGPARAH